MGTDDLPRPLIFGEVLFDRFPEGSSVLGGAPFNVAWNLQAFGLRPLFISRVGDDGPGRDIREAMEAWDMDTAGLQTDSSHATGAVQVTIEDDEPSFEILSDRAYDHIHGDGLPAASASLLYHGTLALRSPASRDALNRCRERYGAPVFVDVNLREPWWSWESVLHTLDGARWAKLNEAELATLVPDLEDRDERARSLQERFELEGLFITRGSQGALARTRDGTTLSVAPGRGQTLVDTVGAGDAFASVLVLGLIREWDLQQTLERAQQFASAVVGLRGATVRDPQFYRTFVETWETS